MELLYQLSQRELLNRSRETRSVYGLFKPNYLLNIFHKTVLV